MLNIARANIALPLPQPNTSEKSTVAIGCPRNELKMIADWRLLTDVKTALLSQTLANAADLVDFGRAATTTSMVAFLLEANGG
jgi:hypothetical protein